MSETEDGMGRHRAVEVVSGRQVAVEAGFAGVGLVGVVVLGIGVLLSPEGDYVLIGLFVTCVVVLLILLAEVAGTVRDWIEQGAPRGQQEAPLAAAELEPPAAGARMPRDWEGR